MSTTLSRSSLGSLARCKSCSALTSSSRFFSSSAPLSKIGPESPKFIEVPRSIQPSAQFPRTIKGTLPVPRNLFKAGMGDKTSLEYLASVTPEPVAASSLEEPANPYVAWKRSMAAKRRQNLREGLIGLHERKAKADLIVTRRSRAKQQDRERRLHAPVREDERLMSSTITAEMTKLQVGNLPDPNRENRLLAAAANVKAKEQERQDRRQNALHTLYMNARNFITSEAQLDAEIDKLFVEKPFTDVFSKSHTTNIWDAKGAPPTVQELVQQGYNGQRTTIEYGKGSAVTTGKRMVRLAEELTGGKMD